MHLRLHLDVSIRSHLYADTNCTRQDHSGPQDHFRTQHALAELKNSIPGIQEDLEDYLAQVQATISTAKASLLALGDEQARLRSSLDGLTQVQRIVDRIRLCIVIERNRAVPGSQAIFGTDTSQPPFNLKVLGNVAGEGSLMVSGVYNPQAIQDILKSSRMPSPP